MTTPVHEPEIFSFNREEIKTQRIYIYELWFLLIWALGDAIWYSNNNLQVLNFTVNFWNPRTSHFSLTESASHHRRSARGSRREIWAFVHKFGVAASIFETILIIADLLKLENVSNLRRAVNRQPDYRPGDSQSSINTCLLFLRTTLASYDSNTRTT